jgi:hypothetical protein
MEEEREITMEREDFASLVSSIYMDQVCNTKYAILYRNEKIKASRVLSHRKPTDEYLWPVPWSELSTQIGCSNLMHDAKYLRLISASQWKSLNNKGSRMNYDDDEGLDGGRLIVGNDVLNDAFRDLLRTIYHQQQQSSQIEDDFSIPSSSSSFESGKEEEEELEDNNDELLEEDFDLFIRILCQKFQFLMDQIWTMRKAYMKRRGQRKTKSRKSRKSQKGSPWNQEFYTWETVIQAASDSFVADGQGNSFSREAICNAFEKANCLFPRSKGSMHVELP